MYTSSQVNGHLNRQELFGPSMHVKVGCDAREVLRPSDPKETKARSDWIRCQDITLEVRMVRMLIVIILWYNVWYLYSYLDIYIYYIQYTCIIIYIYICIHRTPLNFHTTSLTFNFRYGQMSSWGMNTDQAKTTLDSNLTHIVFHS